MAYESSPAAGPPARAVDLRLAGHWLAQHGLTGARPTPLLAARLAVRRRVRLVAQLTPAVLIVASALAARPVFDGPQARRPLPLLALTTLVIGLLLAQALLDRWVRRVDRRAGAALPRRVAHPIRLGRRAVLGRPYTVFVVAAFAGAMALPGSALAIPDPTVRQLAVVVLIGQLGATAIFTMQLRHLLRRPVVAEDEDSLTADVIMRVEDARDLTTPNVQSSLPMVLMFGAAPGWWGAAAVAYLVLSLTASVVLRFKTASSATVARRAMSLR
ncbi:hypothetical protein C1I98_30615 [Spongiactinospora gelatinilytica]|uniref:Uncharacterized protein n=1 Tax=Spongiactinospora gelatinilytica TaxID=2666298 RepID=A0A2W2F272_9ACTN|nr:hypothetical protein [Spongiactinospora gelatinilytica]PZG30996.1 hypothetical protein C1I98_30615 [Spongiactinospora gelatinilytica]